MRITIHYHAQLRQAIGSTFEAVEIAQSMTLKQLICRLADQHGDPLRPMLLTEAGGPHRSLLLFVDEEQVRIDSNQLLRDNAQVILFSPIAGG